MTVLLAFGLCVLLAAGWVLTLLGMPGNWLIVAATAAYAWLVPTDSLLAIGWEVVIVVAALAIVGELLELAAGALGVSKVGGSRRSAVLALVGSMIGSIVGIIIGVPVPIVGSLIAAVLFGGVGALAGAMVGEQWKGRGWEQSWHTGRAAFWGRLCGTLGKTLVSSVMAAIVVAALMW